MKRVIIPVGEEVLVFACRWAMGRAPSFADIAVNHVVAYWETLSPELRKTLVKEIEVDLSRGICTAPAFADPWIRLLKWSDNNPIVEKPKETV